MKIELTRSQVDNLIEFFEFEFIDSVRDNSDVDNMEYLVDMCEIYQKLKEVQKNNG